MFAINPFSSNFCLVLIVKISDDLDAIFHIMCVAGMGVVMMFVLHTVLSLVEVTVQVFLYATGLNSSYVIKFDIVLSMT